VGDATADLGGLDRLHAAAAAAKDAYRAVAGDGTPKSHEAQSRLFAALLAWKHSSTQAWPAVSAEVRRLRAERDAAVAVLRDLAESYEGPYDHAELRRRAVEVLRQLDT
jgi:hypothetical protein